MASALNEGCASFHENCGKLVYWCISVITATNMQVWNIHSKNHFCEKYLLSTGLSNAVRGYWSFISFYLQVLSHFVLRTFVRRLWINNCFPWYFMIWCWCQYIRLSSVAIIGLQTHNFTTQHQGDFDCSSLPAGLGGNGEFERKWLK